MASEFDALSDLELERIAASSREAFGALYERHADRVYDFVLRIVRDPDEAADVTQETFVRAFRAITPERAGQAALTSWLLTIARNIAINRVQRGRTTPLSAMTGPDAQPFDTPAEAALSEDPERAAETRELAALVWEAAAGLEERQYAVLDLHVRQGLEPGELAGVLGVSKGNAYTILSRTKDAFESAVGALLMLRRGRRECEELAQTLDKAAIDDLTPQARKLIDRHIARCERCSNRKAQLMKASALFGTLAVLSVPFWRRARMAEAAWNEVCGPDGAGSALAASATSTGSGGGSPQIPLVVGGLGSLFLGALVALIAMQCGSASGAAPVETPTTTPTTAVTASTTPSLTASPPPSATPTRDPSTPTPTPTNTITPTASPTETPQPPWCMPVAGTAASADFGRPIADAAMAGALTGYFAEYMTESGLAPLPYSPSLAGAARQHAAFVASVQWSNFHGETKYIHCDLDLLDQGDRALLHGFGATTGVYENVFFGINGYSAYDMYQKFKITPKQPWVMEDPASDLRFNAMAIECARSDGGAYAVCVQMFGIAR